MWPALEDVPDAGSYRSALLESMPSPPATSTVPSGSEVDEWAACGDNVLPALENRPDAASYISTLVDGPVEV